MVICQAAAVMALLGSVSLAQTVGSVTGTVAAGPGYNGSRAPFALTRVAEAVTEHGYGPVLSVIVPVRSRGAAETDPAAGGSGRIVRWSAARSRNDWEPSRRPVLPLIAGGDDFVEYVERDGQGTERGFRSVGGTFQVTSYDYSNDRQRAAETIRFTNAVLTADEYTAHGHPGNAGVGTLTISFDAKVEYKGQAAPARPAPELPVPEHDAELTAAALQDRLPRAGEVRWEGYVDPCYSWDLAGDHALVAQFVRAVTAPDGRTEAVPPYLRTNFRPNGLDLTLAVPGWHMRRVAVGNDTLVETGPGRRAPAVSVSQFWGYLLAIGPDPGPDRPLRARQVIVWRTLPLPEWPARPADGEVRWDGVLNNRVSTLDGPLMLLKSVTTTDGRRRPVYPPQEKTVWLPSGTPVYAGPRTSRAVLPFDDCYHGFVSAVGRDTGAGWIIARQAVISQLPEADPSLRWVRALEPKPTREGGSRHQLSFSPDGGLLASASGDGLVRVWDVSGGELRRSVEGRYCLGFSPDGRSLLTGRPEQVTWWDAAGGAGQRQVALDPSAVYLSLSKDARWVLGWDVKRWAHYGTPLLKPQLWEASTGKLDKWWPKWTEDPCAIAFTPDGQRLAGVATGGLEIWNLATRRRERRLTSAAELGQPLVFSADGARVACGGLSRLPKKAFSIVVWDVDSGRLLGTVPPAGAGDPYQGVPAGVFALSSDGRLLADVRPGRPTPCRPSMPLVRLWGVEAGRILNEVVAAGPSHDYATAVKAIAFSRDGRHLAVSVEQQDNHELATAVVNVWDLEAVLAPGDGTP